VKTKASEITKAKYNYDRKLNLGKCERHFLIKLMPTQVTPNILFYDGQCGLCHRWVTFVLPRDEAGERFQFAPLQGETIRSKLSEQDLATLPDSIVVIKPDGQQLVKSDAAIYVLSQMDGAWSNLALVMRCVPRMIRDALYNGVAKVRHKLFKKPDDVCPMLPTELRGRFLA